MTAPGRVTRFLYVSPPGRSSLELTSNFVDTLTAKGFKPVFTCAGQGVLWQESFAMLKYNQKRPETLVVPERTEPLRNHVLDHVFAANLTGAGVNAALTDLRYTVLKKSESSGDTYAAVYGARHVKGNNVYARALSDRVAILDDDDPRNGKPHGCRQSRRHRQSIATQGRAVFYGILFDFDKADIKPESKAQLAEMAKYLQTNPAVRAFVIGHTDDGAAARLQEHGSVESSCRSSPQVIDHGAQYRCETPDCTRSRSSRSGGDEPNRGRSSEESPCGAR